MKVADVDASAESAKRSDNNSVIFFFYDPSYLFSISSIYFPRYVKYFTTFSSLLPDHIIQYLSVFLYKLKHH